MATTPAPAPSPGTTTAGQDELARQQLVNQQEANQTFTPYVQPQFGSLVDPRTGQLGSEYQVNISGLDPTQWAGYQEQQKEALRTAPSAWATLQDQQIAAQTKANQEAGARQAAGASDQANNSLAMYGGESAGARAMNARAGQKALLDTKQEAARQGTTNAQNVAIQDETNRQAQLQNLSSSETNIGEFNKNVEAQQDQYNTGNLLSEKNAQRQYNLDAYNKQMDTYAAEKQAEATRNSGGGGGGCCFIFLEARYGNGTMDKVVRRFRDENMTDKNRRGYYKLSEVLVPLMRKSKVVKFIVRVTMTDPLVAFGKAHYGGNRLGFIFAPVKNFWLKTFDYLGQDHKYIRENGEVI